MPDIVPLPPIRTAAQLRAQADDLKARPNFVACNQAYTKGVAAFREAARPFGKLIANEDRFRIVNYIFHLWAEGRAAGGDGALTYGTIHEVSQRGQVTARVLKNTLALGVHLGFLERKPNPADRRSWLYAPTELGARFPHQWLIPATESLDRLVDGETLTERIQNDPEVTIRFFLGAGREFASGLEPAILVPDYMHFCGHREGAPLVAMALLIAEMEGKPNPSRGEIAARYGLTKSQVALVISAGVELGFISLENGSARPTDALRDGNADWTAVALAFLHYHLR
ncbi:hypothetical protein SAMN06295905_1431 [Devosia lucknowensis]|uniref:Uncharacterized protein n=1 Tax=Devosia lucknowensis TaxID=1096929 RepID=A0A1Y6F0E8_9HYPH|nr:MarR family winged helix-turn-helix transcriptional regulator [Devosia lucknowensis]SMQ66242.1 hypothetical protein SAMN06295905_1431 [Devosia lucknowensis]